MSNVACHQLGQIRRNKITLKLGEKKLQKDQSYYVHGSRGDPLCSLRFLNVRQGRKSYCGLGCLRNPTGANRCSKSRRGWGGFRHGALVRGVRKGGGQKGYYHRSPRAGGGRAQFTIGGFAPVGCGLVCHRKFCHFWRFFPSFIVKSGQKEMLQICPISLFTFLVKMTQKGPGTAVPSIF